MCGGDDRFVILLGHQRCGTHFLGSCIGSHPDVAYLDEITTMARIEWMKVHLRTGGDAVAWLESKVGDREERRLLVDCKYNHVGLVGPALEEFIGSRRCIAIRREDNDAWFYSWCHAWFRKVRKLAEYGDTPKEEAVPEHGPPKVMIDGLMQEWQGELIRQMREFEARYLRLADLVLTYEELTGNRHTTALPDWAVGQICELLDVPVRPLTTTMTKMSPTTFAAYVRRMQ